MEKVKRRETCKEKMPNTIHYRSSETHKKKQINQMYKVLRSSKTVSMIRTTDPVSHNTSQLTLQLLIGHIKPVFMRGRYVMSSQTKSSPRIKHSNNNKKSYRSLSVINLKIGLYILLYQEDFILIKCSTATVCFFLRKVWTFIFSNFTVKFL